MVAGWNPFFSKAPVSHPPLSQFNRTFHETNRPLLHSIPVLSGHYCKVWCDIYRGRRRGEFLPPFVPLIVRVSQCDIRERWSDVESGIEADGSRYSKFIIQTNWKPSTRISQLQLITNSSESSEQWMDRFADCMSKPTIPKTRRDSHDTSKGRRVLNG
jgi:hypothetical protein